MRNKFVVLGSMALVALLAGGCADMEQKMGRGMGNMTEIVRGGEFERSVEQGGLFDGPDTGMATGFVRGVNRTLARTGVGIYEVVTFPLPPYHPVCTDYLSPHPMYSDTFQPKKLDDAIFDSDGALGFSGGEVAPWFPGSHFRIFDN